MSENLLKELATFKDTYYKSNTKKKMFNKSQKHDLAIKVTDKFDINVLLQKTAYVIPDTNKIFINYPVFKQYAHPENYESFVHYVQNLIPLIIDKYGVFECHINIDSFTVTSAERHKDVIKLFCRECFNEISYTEYLTNIYIYNTPILLDKIAGIFLHMIDPIVKKKFILIGRDDSTATVYDFIQKHTRNML
jgi:hypothetical protein